MGRLHAENIQRWSASHGVCRLEAIFDHHDGRAETVALGFGARTVDSFADLCAGVDALVVAVPTGSHFDLGRQALEAKLDVLIEKPLAASVAEGEALVELAAAGGRILQVGQVEWFNPLWRRATEALSQITRLEVDRTQVPSPRGRDIDVVEDLMLHDLDWTTRWADSPLATLEATGRRVEGDAFDEVRATLDFESGRVVELFASRVHGERRRELRVTHKDGVQRVSLDPSSTPGAGPLDDPLTAQWADFMGAVTQRRAPVNDGAAGVAALRLVAAVQTAAAHPTAPFPSKPPAGRPPKRSSGLGA